MTHGRESYESFRVVIIQLLHYDPYHMGHMSNLIFYATITKYLVWRNHNDIVT